MDYEKKYKEALSRAKVFELPEYKKIAESIFPELKESEDENIRKALICGMYALKEQHKTCFASIPIDNAIAWLEKQGEQKIDPDTLIQQRVDALADIVAEQKPTDKVEPKFKVGNWYQCTKDFFGKGVTFDKNTAYYCAKEGCLQNEYGCHIAIVKDLYDNFKLWELSDAKDGDVLVDKYNNIGIFQECEGICWHSYIYLGCDGELRGFNNIGGSHEQTDAHPATKEQRDQLEKAMADARYTFDFEKKKLRKIEQKPAWSKEDDNCLSTVIAEFSKCAGKSVSKDEWMRCNDFLKSLKNRVQPKQEWSEEDESYLNTTIAYLKDAKEFKKTADNCINWLKSLRSQPKKEWSEEDEEFLRRAINATKDAYPMTAKWLKSLRPQNRWEPSDEQMKVLEELVEDNNQRYFYSILKSLYEQLKKLK